MNLKEIEYLQYGNTVVFVTDFSTPNGNGVYKAGDAVPTYYLKKIPSEKFAELMNHSVINLVVAEGQSFDLMRAVDQQKRDKGEVIKYRVLGMSDNYKIVLNPDQAIFAAWGYTWLDFQLQINTPEGLALVPRETPVSKAKKAMSNVSVVGLFYNMGFCCLSYSNGSWEPLDVAIHSKISIRMQEFKREQAATLKGLESLPEGKADEE